MSIDRRSFMQGSLALVALQHASAGLSEKGSTAIAEELWYKQPAKRWLEALPVGNGRLGGMVFGGIQNERIALSDSTAWSGAPAKGEVNPEALPHLREIRELFFAGKYDEAQTLCSKYLPGRMKNFGTNLPLPDLQLAFEHVDQPVEYRRSLSLDDAIAAVRFQCGGVQFVREIFATHADGVIAVQLTANQRSAISFRMTFSKDEIPNTTSTEGQDTLVLNGSCFEHKHSSGHDGVAIQIRAQVIARGGATSATAQGITVSSADAVTILLATGTSFRGDNREKTSREALRRASGKSFAKLRQAHLEDYQPLYRRTSLDLGSSSESTRLQPTDARRRALEDGGDDPELVTLFFQYGRYLTIAGSRADSVLPLALQGIWNDGLASSMGWTDDFHLDINTQQNYWPTEVCNLSECHAPLFGLIEGLASAGKATAREMYGSPGWVAHTVTNPWGYTAPGGIGWGIVVTAGLWIATQMWQHYEFTRDTEFLRDRAYPVLREAAEFFLAYMVEEPKHGWLVTGPSDSPENWYITPPGQHASESMGNTIDRVFVHALFSMVVEACATLSTDADLRSRVEAARAKLPPLQIGRHGQLQEWMEDFEDAEPNHRHTSHLTSLYPLHQISPRTTPALASASEVTIQRRMSAPHWEQSEWGRANLVVYYARLLKGEEAHRHLVSLIAKAADDNLMTYSSAGVAGADSNIFAIDGNTAGSAGIAEMLLQSQDGEIELLPALPTPWRNGAFRGLCARGGYVVAVKWRDGKLSSATIGARRSGSVPVRYRDRITQIHLQAGQQVRLRPENFLDKAAAISDSATQT
ncbi:glycoside hydrolase family 95 protein [Tunturiibacter gelidoferens]|uniref:Alpha-L-fucosidase 2 n=1 Tax=Tunturiibacter lichenicola TaxID=2051959 RepID=A0A7Y9NK50_9BACT|nr:glycoside hydrolase family 95 protein [Edaphobacter lichenicola]NYF50707.1 alpha-L-fucosidase 2 [Edaphobacter lichenicola]